MYDDKHLFIKGLVAIVSMFLLEFFTFCFMFGLFMAAVLTILSVIILLVLIVRVSFFY